MANDVNRLIDMLYERIEDAKSPALKPNMSMVDRDELLDLLDELRAQLPVEIKRAQELLSARDKFVEDAKRDVDRMMRQAELDAKTKVSDSEVLYAACLLYTSPSPCGQGEGPPDGGPGGGALPPVVPGDQ